NHSTTDKVPHANSQPSRRHILAMSGALTTGSILGTAPFAQTASASENYRIHEEVLGPGVTSHPIMSGELDGETLYLGSRNLNPPRVAAFHIPSRRVTETYRLSTGNYVEG